ncbi:MAG: amidohydrolase family protein [Nitrospinota bacterium]
MAIDPHTHILPTAFLDDLRKGRLGKAVRIEQGEDTEWMAFEATIFGVERSWKNILNESYYVVDIRLEAMKRMGVERQVLSVSPFMTLYALDAGMNKELSASINDGLSALARSHPDRFSCMAQVPLQDSVAAAEELERAVGIGHIGVQIAANVAGGNLDDPDLDAFWEKAVALDVPVFIHPQGQAAAPERLQDYYLRNFIGNPLDTTIAVSCLIFGGVLDRFPDIKFYLSHVGGFVPWIRGRWQHGYGERPEPKVRGAKDPEQYFDKFYYDTIIHSADAFEYAVKTLGADRVLYGTDYPADMGNHQPARDIPGLTRLSEADQEKILTANAKKLYKL